MLLITLIVVIVHGLHVPDLEATEGHFRREVLARWATDRLAGGDTAQPTGATRLRVLEVSSGLRIRELEPGGGQLPETAIARLQGIRPLARCKTADLLQRLAGQLPAATGASPPGRLVVIDFDLAPIGSNPAGDCVPEMSAVLGQLRQKATVLAILMSRQDPADRQARNAFWTQAAQCTGATPPAAADVRAAPRQPLYLASPQVFHAHHGYPLDFPVGPRRAWLGAPDAAQAREFGAVFPSVGNLIGVVLGSTPPSDDGARALIALCAQMAPPWSAEACTLEDRLDASSAAARSACAGQGMHGQRVTGVDATPTINRVARLAHSAYNWRLREDRQLGFTPLVRLQQLSTDCTGFDCIDGRLLNVPVLVLSVDGGAGRDEYAVPNVTPDRVSGAELHALQHLSQLPGQVMHANSAVAVLADFIAGLLFLGAWVAARLWLDSLRRWPRLAGALKIAVPMLLVVVAVDCVFRRWLSPWLVGHDYWINPIFVLTGMLLHAYAEAWHGTHEAQQQHGLPHAPDFSFGLLGVVKAWRDTGTGDAAVACIDLSLVAALQWVVLGWATYLLVKPGAVHGGLWLALAMWIAVVTLIVRHWPATSEHHPRAMEASAS